MLKSGKVQEREVLVSAEERLNVQITNVNINEIVLSLICDFQRYVKPALLCLFKQTAYIFTNHPYSLW